MKTGSRQRLRKALLILAVLCLVTSPGCEQQYTPSILEFPLGLSLPSQYPEPGETDAGKDTTISLVIPSESQVVEFSSRPDIEVAYIGQYSMDDGTARIIIFPEDLLLFNTPYSITVRYRDSGGKMVDVKWQFTTESASGHSAHFIIRTTGDDVHIWKPIYVDFPRGHADDLLNSVNLIMEPSVEIEDGEAYDYGLASAMISFKPKTPLQPNTTYTAILSRYSGAACSVWQFTTAE